MSILLLAVFLLPIFAEECIDSESPCSTSRSPLKVFATFSALIILLVVPFLICTIIRRIRQPAVPPDETLSPLPPSYSTSAPTSSGLHTEFKGPRMPPPSYSPT